VKRRLWFHRQRNSQRYVTFSYIPRSRRRFKERTRLPYFDRCWRGSCERAQHTPGDPTFLSPSESNRSPIRARRSVEIPRKASFEAASVFTVRFSGAPSESRETLARFDSIDRIELLVIKFQTLRDTAWTRARNHRRMPGIFLRETR